MTSHRSGRAASVGFLAFTLLVGMGVTAIPCEAQTDASEAEAREHFEIGRRLYDLGRFQEAANEFRRAYDLSGRPALLMNIYLSHRDAAEPLQAAEALREYLRVGEVAPEERPQLENRLRALERQAEASGASGASEAERERPVSSGPDITVPAILLGAGGAALLAGVGTGVGAALEHDALVTACPNQRCEPAEASRIDTVRSLTIATDVLLPLGIAAAGAGLVWLVIELASASPNADAQTAWRLSPTCGLDGCAGVVEASW